MLVATWIGDWTTRLVVIAVAALWLSAGRRWGDLVWFLSVVALAAVAGSGFKHLFQFSRPSILPHLDQVSTFAFPSGHAGNSAALAGALALLARRRWAVWMALVVSALIGISRVWLGVHWPTDVLAGWLLAGAVLFAAAPLRPERARAPRRWRGIGWERRTMADLDKEQIWDDFHDAVNMAPQELEDFLQTEESKEVGWTKEGEDEAVGHKSGKRIVDIKRTKKADLSDDDYEHMRKVVGYVHRHAAQGGPEEDKEHSPWRYSLMNWGHDPCQ